MTEKMKGKNASTFAKEVIESAASRKFSWDFLENHYLAQQSTQEAIAKAEAGGIPRDRYLRLVLSLAALRTSPTGSDELASIFEMCGLDPGKPLHWRALLDALVEVGFKSAGAAVEWDDLSYYQLACDIRELQKLQPRLKTHSELTRELRKTRPFKERYSKRSPDYLRKRVAEARTMEPTDSLEEFMVKRRGNKFDLPEGYVKAYIERASASVAAEQGFSPDVADVLIAEAEKITGLKRSK